MSQKCLPFFFFSFVSNTIAFGKINECDSLNRQIYGGPVWRYSPHIFYGFYVFNCHRAIPHAECHIFSYIRSIHAYEIIAAIFHATPLNPLNRCSTTIFRWLAQIVHTYYTSRVRERVCVWLCECVFLCAAWQYWCTVHKTSATAIVQE